MFGRCLALALTCACLLLLPTAARADDALPERPEWVAELLPALELFDLLRGAAVVEPAIQETDLWLDNMLDVSITIQRSGRRSDVPGFREHSRALTVGYAVGFERGDEALKACALWELAWLNAHLTVWRVPRYTWVFPAELMADKGQRCDWRALGLDLD